MNKSKQYLLCVLNFVCFEGTLLLCLEPHAVRNEVSNPVEGAVSSPVKQLV